MNPTNQAPANASNLQNGGGLTQQAGGNFQTGSTLQLDKNGNTTNLLNQGLNSGGLRVEVASTTAPTATSPDTLAIGNSSGNGSSVWIILILLLFIVVGIIFYRRRTSSLIKPSLIEPELSAPIIEAPISPAKPKKPRKRKRKHGRKAR